MATGILLLVSVSIAGLYLSSVSQTSQAVARAEDHGDVRFAMARLTNDLRGAKHMMLPSGSCSDLSFTALNDNGEEVEVRYCVQDQTLKRQTGDGPPVNIARNIADLKVNCSNSPPQGSWQNNCGSSDEMVHIRITGAGTSEYQLQTTVQMRNTFELAEMICISEVVNQLVKFLTNDLLLAIIGGLPGLERLIHTILGFDIPLELVLDICL